MTLAVVILAAGQGTRMQSKKQKILHEVGGRPMVEYAFLAAEHVSDTLPVLVVGPGETGVPALIGDRATYVTQPEALGTGHATRMAAAVLDGQTDQVIVTYADMPLLRLETLARLAQCQQETGAAVVLLSMLGDASSSFGRVLRDENGNVVDIIEVAEAHRQPNTAELLAIPELNVGVYCFDAPWLWENIDQLPLRQARGKAEYYLTDMVAATVAQGRPVEAVRLDDPDEGLGAGTRAELVVVEKAFRRRTNDYWLDHGVTLIDPPTTYIDPQVVLGQDTIIWPNSFLLGQTSVGEECVIGPNTTLREAQIGRRCRIEYAVVEKCSLPDDTIVPPFSKAC